MAHAFRLEDPGEGIHEAEIVEIHVSEGDEVADGDILLTIETDKAAVEVPSPFSGVIEQIRVDEGDVIEVGDVLITYRSAGTDEGSAEENAPAKKESARAETEEEPSQGESEEERTEKKEDRGDRRKERKREAEASSMQRGKPKIPIPASPSTRRLARERGVDLREVEGSGPNGRVTAEDVERRAGADDREQRGTEAQAPRKPRSERREFAANRLVAAYGVELPDFAVLGQVDRVPLRSIRRATAQQMARAWAQIPHVVHQDAVDITELERFRRAHKAAVEERGGTLTLTVLVIKALLGALKQHPRFNASLDPEAEEIVIKRYYNIGVAVDTEQGLMAPVIHDADRKSIVELSRELAELSNKARSGELTPAELQGSTFTVTNPGPLGGRAFAPIINYPEAAILGLAKARLEAQVEGTVDDFEIRARLMLPVCVAFDHRINDGADAARFTRTFAELLSDPDSILLLA